MPEEKVLPSEDLYDDSSDHDADFDDFEPIARRDDETFSTEMKHSRKKALLELRCRVQDAILGNYLYGKKRRNLFSNNNNNNTRKDESLRDIRLWGVPLLPSKGHEGTDSVLLRFLKARGYKASEAFKMLRKTLKWRREFRADEILEEKFSPELEAMWCINGTDKEGRPLCYCSLGDFKNRELQRKIFGPEKSSVDQFLRWRVQCLEKGIQKLNFTPGGAKSIILITDLKNAPGPAVKEVRCINKYVLSLLQHYYPGIVLKNLIVNVPGLFLAFHAINLRLIAQRSKNKFVFVRTQKVTESLLKYATPENIPIQYGGLKRENDTEFSTSDKILEATVKSNAVERIQIPVNEVEVTVSWDMTVVGDEVTCKEEFIPEDECSYKVLLQKERKMRGTVRNSFYIREPGKIVLTIDNPTYKKKKAFYRYKTKPSHVPSYIIFK